MPPVDTLAAARTMLFVPGDRPDRFDKAAASGADVVVLDLEDAVAPERKVAARENVLAWLDAGHDAAVRINGTGTPWHAGDMAALGGAPRALMLPKAERGTVVAALADRLPAGSAFLPIVETAAGVLDAREVCAAPGVVRPAFGSIDLAAQLGVDPTSRPALAAARSMLVLAAAAAGCSPPLDGVTTALHDDDAVTGDTRYAAGLGFTGKLCIHPRQVAPVHRALAPTEAELDWARGVLAASDGSAAAHGGHMVDRPVLLRARHLLRRASQSDR